MESTFNNISKINIGKTGPHDPGQVVWTTLTIFEEDGTEHVINCFPSNDSKENPPYITMNAGDPDGE